MKIPTILVVISLILFYIIIPLLVWIFARESKLGKLIVIVFTVLFSVILYFGITSRISINKDLVTVAIDYSGNWCDKVIKLNVLSVDIVDLIINLIMLIPIGLVVAYFLKRKVVYKLAIAAVVGLLIGLILESIQFILPVYRSPQLTDIILNMVSVVIGCCIGIVYDKLYYKLRREKWRNI